MNGWSPPRPPAPTRIGSRLRALAIRRWDDLTRKLQVGVAIRAGGLGDEPRRLSEGLRERLEDLRDALLQGRPDDARDLVSEVERAYKDCRQVYLGKG